MSSRYRFLPSIYVPFFCLNYFRISETEGPIAIDYHQIHKDQPRIWSLLQRLLIYQDADRTGPSSGANLDRGLRMFINQSTMPLPPKGEEVPLPGIKEICEHFDLHTLWLNSAQDPPPRPSGV